MALVQAAVDCSVYVPTVQPVPIHIVREDGRVERLGEWRAPVLVLERAGFPLLGPGEHTIEGHLPWVFWEMCPSGFLGRTFALRYPELALQPDPRLWGAAECLRAIGIHGADLPGNLVVGEGSLAELQARRADPSLELRESNAFQALQFEALRESGGSSMGGDRPKIAAGMLLIKYTPPVSTELGERWRDLLRSEHHCAETLRAAGITAVKTVLHQSAINDRFYLPIIRYDRVEQSRGRRGATTLYFYAADRLGDVSLPAPQVVRTLVDDGHLPESAFDTCSLVHEFSAAIGNSDAHLGNYGLTFDEEGHASLAPIFDVLPMALAPRNDELPDAYLRARTSSGSEHVRPLVDALESRIDGDDQISPRFKALWRSHFAL